MHHVPPMWELRASSGPETATDTKLRRHARAVALLSLAGARTRHTLQDFCPALHGFVLSSFQMSLFPLSSQGFQLSSGKRGVK